MNNDISSSYKIQVLTNDINETPIKKTESIIITGKNIILDNPNKTDFSEFDGGSLLKSKIELRKQIKKHQRDESIRMSFSVNGKFYFYYY